MYPSYIALIILSIYIINCIPAIYIYFSRKPLINKKTWLLWFIILPIVSILLFFIYSFIKSNHIHQNMLRKTLEENKKLISNDNDNNPIFRKINNLTNFKNQINLNEGKANYIFNNEDSFKITIDLIRSAKKTIYLEYYLLRNGIWLNSILNELIKKSNEGIEIFFIYDFMGTKGKVDLKILKRLETKINVCIFKPKKYFILSAADNSRCHKKVLIIDNEKAFYGGSNIADEYLNLSWKYHYWNDSNFVFEGEIVINFINHFIIDWNNPLNDSNLKMNIETELAKYNKINSVSNNILSYNSFPEFENNSIDQLLSIFILKAAKKIVITTPYFYPSNCLIENLILISNLGIEIKLILPGLPDNKKFIVKMNQILYKKCLDNNFEIFETYSFNHSKTIVIDDDISIIGTFNLDLRSLVINYESLCVIVDEKLNKDITKKNNEFIKNSKKITLDNYELNKRTKLIQNILLAFEPSL